MSRLDHPRGLDLQGSSFTTIRTVLVSVSLFYDMISQSRQLSLNANSDNVIYIRSCL